MNPTQCILAIVTALLPPMGCAAQPTFAPPPHAVPQPDSPTLPHAATPAIKATAGTSEDQQAARQVAAVLSRVSALRGLLVSGPVHAKVIDRDQMLVQVKRQVRAQVPPESIRGERDFLAAFGFIPDDYDYEAEVYRLIQSQVAGYYDPDVKLMFLMTDLSSEEADVTLAHELVHALQDQHFALGPKLKFRPDGNDEQSAIHCLAEGDATSLMLDYTLRHQAQDALSIPDERLRLEILAGVAASPDLASFPRVLRDSLVAPYVDGILFVHALRRRGGWAAVDAAWRNPPRTTEQVLHLDKLDAREPPEALSVAPASTLGAGWRVAHTDVFGEQGLRIALEEWMPRQVAIRSAAGWSGDRLAVWTFGTGEAKESAAAWRVRFDPGGPAQPQDREAKEAFDNLVRAWDVLPKAGAACWLAPSGRAIAVSQKERDLALVAVQPQRHSDRTQPPFGCALAIRWAKETSAAR